MNYIENARHIDKLNKMCQTNKIKLLRVPYWKFKNIDKILKEEIFYGL